MECKHEQVKYNLDYDIYDDLSFIYRTCEGCKKKSKNVYLMESNTMSQKQLEQLYKIYELIGWDKELGWGKKDE